jgi:hypothetical protein
MRANPFESQLERLARTLTEQFGVQVTCQGDNAWTDGTQIVLPSVPTPMDEDLEKCLIGYLDHEMAHVACSDFTVAVHFAKKHPGFDGLLNVVEDALVKRRAMERWPGVRRNLDMMFRQIRGRVARPTAEHRECSVENPVAPGLRAGRLAGIPAESADWDVGPCAEFGSDRRVFNRAHRELNTPPPRLLAAIRSYSLRLSKSGSIRTICRHHL